MSKSKSKSAKKSGRVIRIVATKSGALIGCTKSGTIIDARVRARHGLKQVKSWTEVAADSWAQATKLYRAGRGSKGSSAKAA